ncbi:MAG: nucleotidyltransferase domain-containing protein [Candidatus Omnitrophota bacterium]
MLKADAPIEQIAKEAVDFLSKYIRVEKVILFGSYGYGTPRKDSDFDIAVISEDFEKMSVLEKIDLFARASVMVDSRVELVGFSKREFLNPESPSLLRIIKEKGKVIF